MNSAYATDAPSRGEIDALAGPTVLEFGADGCGYCQAAQPLIASALKDHVKIQHLKIEDGKGRPLGRSFHVKLWPTLIFLRDGKEVARLVRPTDSNAIKEALERVRSEALKNRG